MEPVFKKVLAELAASKEAADIAMGLRKNRAMEATMQAKQRKKERDEKKKQRKLAKLQKQQEEEEDELAAEKALADRLLQEQRKALEAMARAAEREKAWYMAHPHKFIRHEGEPAFCIVCLEKEAEYWLKTHKESEQQWRAGLDTFIQESIDEKEQAGREAVERQMKDALTVEAEKMVAIEMALEAKQEEEENSALRIGGRSLKGLKPSPMKLFQAASW